MPIFLGDAIDYNRPKSVESSFDKSADETSYACKMSCEGNPIGNDSSINKGNKLKLELGLTEEGIVTPFDKNLEGKTVTSDQKFKDKIEPNEDSLIIKSPYDVPPPEKYFEPAKEPTTEENDSMRRNIKMLDEANFGGSGNSNGDRSFTVGNIHPFSQDINDKSRYSVTTNNRSEDVEYLQTHDARGNELPGKDGLGVPVKDPIINMQLKSVADLATILHETRSSAREGEITGTDGAAAGGYGPSGGAGTAGDGRRIYRWDDK